MPCFLKRLTLVTSFACLSLQNSWAQPQAAVPLTPTASAAKVFAYTDVDQAWVEVQQSQRPLLLFVSANNCYFCDKMEIETYVHPQIQASIRELLVTAKIKKEQNPRLVDQLGVRAFPTTLLIAPNGDLIARIEGFANPKKFVHKIRPALAELAKHRDRTAGRPAESSTTDQQ
jgi:thioredoxin-related protein